MRAWAWLISIKKAPYRGSFWIALAESEGV